MSLCLLRNFYEEQAGKLGISMPRGSQNAQRSRTKEYTDLLSVEIGEACKCESCGEFIKGKENTYIFFRATDEWVNFLKKIEEKEAIKAKEKELARIKNEADIIKQLNRILDTFENIPEGGLSIEGKIIRSQINTYLNSKKEAM